MAQFLQERMENMKLTEEIMPKLNIMFVEEEFNKYGTFELMPQRTNKNVS